MEQVEGGSLRDRQARLARERTSPWRPILDLYVAAGRGLAAAHAAGIVHRDFKPDNVLVDGEGGVLVADFGLAFAAERPPPRVARGTGPTRIPAARDWIGIGTPGYISSEQYLGRAVDARADQFAFCVSLWEALYGERPFAGDDEAAYVRELMAGRVRPARAERGVPTWIRDVLTRGLRPDPESRYPSMDALLAELDCDDPSAVRGSRTLGMIALTVLFTVLGAYPVFDDERGVGGIAVSIGIALFGFLLVSGVLRGRERLTPLQPSPLRHAVHLHRDEPGGHRRRRHAGPPRGAGLPRASPLLVGDGRRGGCRPGRVAVDRGSRLRGGLRGLVPGPGGAPRRDRGRSLCPDAQRDRHLGRTSRPGKNGVGL